MEPCDGCGATGTYDSELPGYRIKVCNCETVRSVVQHPQRPMPPKRWANRRGKLNGLVALRRVLDSSWLRRYAREALTDEELRLEIERRTMVEARAESVRKVDRRKAMASLVRAVGEFVRGGHE
jgi:hypothetical protein